MNKYQVAQLGTDYSKEVIASSFEVRDGAIIFYTKGVEVAVFPTAHFTVVKTEDDTTATT